MGRRNVLGGWRRAFTEEELFHLFHDHFLILFSCWVQAIFVEEHFAILRPLAPGLLRDLVVDFVAEFGIERRFLESGQFLLQLDAKNFVL